MTAKDTAGLRDTLTVVQDHLNALNSLRSRIVLYGPEPKELAAHAADSHIPTADANTPVRSAVAHYERAAERLDEAAEQLRLAGARIKKLLDQANDRP